MSSIAFFRSSSSLSTSSLLFTSSFALLSLAFPDITEAAAASVQLITSLKGTKKQAGRAMRYTWVLRGEIQGLLTLGLRERLLTLNVLLEVCLVFFCRPSLSLQRTTKEEMSDNCRHDPASRSRIRIAWR